MNSDRKKSGTRALLLFSAAHGVTHTFPVTLAAVLPLVKNEFQISYLLIGTITLLMQISRSLASIPAGVLTDAYCNKGKLIGVSFLVVAFCSVLLLFAHSVLSVTLVLISISVLLSISHPVAHSYLSTRYRDNKGAMFGIYEVGGSIGMVIAPLGVSSLGITYGWRVPYVVWGGSGVVISLLLYLVFSNNYPHTAVKTTRLDFSKHLRNGIRMIRSSAKLRSAVLVQGIVGFLFGGIVTFLPAFLVDTHDFPARRAAYALALFLTAGMVGKLAGGYLSDRWGRRETMIACFLGICPLLGFVPFAEGKLLLTLLLSVGFGFCMIVPGSIALVGDVSERSLGFSYGIQGLVGAGFAGVSRFACGWIAYTLGIESIFFLFSVVALFGSGFALCFIPRGRHFQRAN